MNSYKQDQQEARARLEKIARKVRKTRIAYLGALNQMWETAKDVIDSGLLTKRETARILGTSRPTLDRNIKEIRQIQLFADEYNEIK